MKFTQVFFLLEAIDMTGKKCAKCKKGTYGETSQFDDMDGKLHCRKCGHEIARYTKEPADIKREKEKDKGAGI